MSEVKDLHIGDPVAWRLAKMEALRGKICFGGLDLGVVNDFTCLADYFPKQPGVPIAVLLAWFWAPEQTEHHKVLKERLPYDNWVRQGFIELTPGNVTDYEFVEKRILEINRNYRLKECAFDRYNANQLVQRLRQKDGVPMVEHGQGTVSMDYPIKEFYRIIAGREFVHGFNPVLAWMIDNLVVKSDANGNLRCVKPGNPSNPRKIDGAVASIMAVGRSAANPQTSSSRPMITRI